jgi:hypothetical protein
VDAPNFNPQIDTFWGKARGHYNYALERNSLYLNWRYTDPRAGKFVIKQAVEGDQILGYVILESKKEGGYSEGYISDLLASPNRDDVADTLMAEACSYFDRLNINSINFWVAKNHPYLGIAERHASSTPSTRYISGAVVGRIETSSAASSLRLLAKYISNSGTWTSSKRTTPYIVARGIDGAVMLRMGPNSVWYTVSVDNIDNTLKKIEKAGEKVFIPKREIPKQGWIAYCIDTFHRIRRSIHCIR